jgi:S-adenosylmethionine/arginine decarboxylase-like enzyme
MEYWGYHLILDCAGLNPESIRDEKNIYNFAKQLVKDIDMVAYGEPQIIKFGHSGKEGYTLVQLIETSNICVHFVDEDNTAYFDIFSCKTYDNDVVIGLVKKYFGATHIRQTYLTRQA